MKNLSLLKEKRLGKEKYQDFDLPSFVKKTFAMYGGRDEKVSMRCQNHLARVKIDKFGKDMVMIPDKTDSFKENVLVTVSSQFFGWLAGLGNEIQITGPEHVKAEYQEYLKMILKQYD